MKNTITTMPAGTEWMKATVPTMTAAIVAPASGTRSRIATSRPSANAKGTPMIHSTTPEKTPAMTLMRRFPVT